MTVSVAAVVAPGAEVAIAALTDRQLALLALACGAGALLASLLAAREVGRINESRQHAGAKVAGALTEHRHVLEALEARVRRLELRTEPKPAPKRKG